MTSTIQMIDSSKPQSIGYQARGLIMEYWCRRYTSIAFIKDIKFIIQLYSYPIPFEELKPLLSYQILTKQMNNNKLYHFEKIDDMFSYKTSDNDNKNDIIYHPLQPIIPNILTAKSTSFSHIYTSNRSSITCTKLRLVLKCLFAKKQQSFVQYKYNGKNKEEIPEIWRCKNSKKYNHFDIIGIDIDTHSVEYKINSKQSTISYVLPIPLFDKLQQHLDNGANLHDIKLKVCSAPLRLPNEKYICIVSVVTDITWYWFNE